MGCWRPAREVTVVAPDIAPAVEREGVTLHRRSFRPDDLDGVWWVVAAAPPEVNREVQAAAEARQLFVNAVDDPAHATAYLGSIVRRDDVTVAISTGGRAPALAGAAEGSTGRLAAAGDRPVDGGGGRGASAVERTRRADGSAPAVAAGNVEPAIRVEEVMSGGWERVTRRCGAWRS